MTRIPNLSDFEAAAEIVAEIAVKTPILRSDALSEEFGIEVLFKPENLQRTGSYKVRGAFNLMSKLSPAEKKAGVVAASAGNHAQGVALAARKLGIVATIFMPVGASLPKYEATLSHGANVILEGATFNETLKAAKNYTATTGAIFIPPFDHLDIIVGQGTVGLEILEEHPDVKNILVGMGGGGFAAGAALAAKLKAESMGKKIRVIGVQAANAASYPISLAEGKPVEITIQPTIADGIAVSKPGKIPFKIINKYVDEVVTVTEDEMATAMLSVFEKSKLVVEPAGVVGVAALMSRRIKLKGKTVIVLSGGNIDPLLMQKVIGHGLAASERYTTISVMLPDRPGQLVKTASAIAAAHGNVVEVLHTRHGKGWEISEVELRLSVETRGKTHRDEVLKALQAEGLNPQIARD
jgi:threonine dehydratase